MKERIKKVQIIRVLAFGGKLSDKQEVLAELPSIKMAEAAIRQWQMIGHAAQRPIIESLRKEVGDHYGCYVWKDISPEPESMGYDRYWNEDFWHGGEEILAERIYTHVVR